VALARRSGVTLEGVAYKDKPEDARRFLDGLGNPYRRVGVDRKGATAIDFGVYGVPETYVVDGGGHIRYRQVGPLSAEDVEWKIVPLIDRITASGGRPGWTWPLFTARVAILAGNCGKKSREVTPAIGDRFDRRSADCERFGGSPDGRRSRS
jgi:hypothetical protein